MNRKEMLKYLFRIADPVFHVATKDKLDISTRCTF